MCEWHAQQDTRIQARCGCELWHTRVVGKTMIAPWLMLCDSHIPARLGRRQSKCDPNAEGALNLLPQSVPCKGPSPPHPPSPPGAPGSPSSRDGGDTPTTSSSAGTWIAIVLLLCCFGAVGSLIVAARRRGESVGETFKALASRVGAPRPGYAPLSSPVGAGGSLLDDDADVFDE